MTISVMTQGFEGFCFFDVDYSEQQRKQLYDKRLTRWQISNSIKDHEVQTEIASLSLFTEDGRWKTLLETVLQA